MVSPEKAAAKLKKTNHVEKLIVMGCFSERYSDELDQELPEVDAFFGTDDHAQVLSYLTGKSFTKDDPDYFRSLLTPNHYAYLKISEGCDRPCSFCAIPLMRGRHKSTPIEQLVTESKNLAKNGVKELILIAQQLNVPLAGGENGYGKDYFDALVLDGLFDIIMPDIKFCGGASEAHNISLSTLRNAGQVSFHNPSGPVSQLCSAQVTAAIPNILPLEHATGEIDWRADLMNPPEIIHNGRYWLPDGYGLGASLNQEFINAKGISW